MFCIYQIDDNATEKIIKIIDNEIDFVNCIKELIVNNFNFKLIESITEKDIKSNGCFRENHYLLVNDKEIKLVKKFQKISKGYVYNSSKYDICVLFTWKLLPFDCPIDETNIPTGFDFLEEDDDIIDSDNDIIDIKNTENEIDVFGEGVFQITPKNRSIGFKKFDLNTLPINSSICLIGKRGSGKQFMVRDILHHLNTNTEFLENTLIIAGTEKGEPFYKTEFPDAKILCKYDNEEIAISLANQGNRIEETRNEFIETGIEYHYNGCIVLDDCLAPKGTWMNDNEILELFYNSHSYGLSFIFTMQIPLGIKPEFRHQFDYVFLFAEESEQNRKKLYNHYADIFSSFAVFEKIFKQLTENGHTMVIDKRKLNTSLTDKVFYI